MRDPKKLFHVQMVVDAVSLHDVMTAADGRAFDVKVSAVKMAGDEPATSLNRVTTTQMVEEFVAAFKGDTFNIARDLVPAIKTRGGSPHAAYPGIVALVKRGVVIKVSPGTYRVKGRQKLLPAPALAQTVKTRQPRGASNREVVMAAITEGPKTSAQLSVIFRKKKRNVKSLSPVLTKLKADKAITMISGGIYQILNGVQQTEG